MQNLSLLEIVTRGKKFRQSSKNKAILLLVDKDMNTREQLQESEFPKLCVWK